MPNPFFWIFMAGVLFGIVGTIIFEGRSYAKTVSTLQAQIEALDADWRDAYETLERQQRRKTAK